jgi:hypothetical protein
MRFVLQGARQTRPDELPRRYGQVTKTLNVKRWMTGGGRAVTRVLNLSPSRFVDEIAGSVPYNARPMIARWKINGVALIFLTTFATSCASTPGGQVIYQQGQSVVEIQPDPTIDPQLPRIRSTKPVISPDQLALILRGITVRSESGLVGVLLSLAVPAEPAFNNEEVALLAPVFSQGLAQATPTERVTFTYWSSKPVRKTAPLVGAISLRDGYLKFTLDEHPTIGWQDPEDPSAAKLFELEFVRPTMLRPGSEKERKRGRQGGAALEIDVHRFFQEPTVETTQMTRPIPPSAPASTETQRRTATVPREPERGPVSGPNAAGTALQQQINELAESNRELQTQVRELTDQLTEAKQLLADKELELNRLKNKSRAGTGKGQGGGVR